MIEFIKQTLTSKNLKIAVAESLTAGHLQTLLSSISWASDFFEWGITAYNIDQKVNLLNIDHKEAEKVNCISPKIAEDMALNVAKKFNTDIGMGTTGYAESNENVPTPFAHYAIAFQWKIIKQWKIEIENLPRVETQKKVAEYVIQQLHDFLKTI